MQQNKFKKVLIFLMIVIFIISVISLYLETNMFVNQPGTQKTESFYINNLVEGEVGGGYLTLVRSSSTPIGVESVSFSNGDKYMFFSISENEQLKEDLTITIPYNMVSGVYYYQISATINGKIFVKDLKYRVG